MLCKRSPVNSSSSLLLKSPTQTRQELRKLYVISSGFDNPLMSTAAPVIADRVSVLRCSVDTVV